MDGNRPALTRGRIRWRYGLPLILFALPLLFLAVFFLYPLASIFALSFAPEGQLDLSAFIDIATSRYYLETLWFTTWQAALSTALTLTLALPGAYAIARYRFPGRSLLLSLSTLPFVLPTVVVAAAFMALVGPRGALNELLMSVFALEAPPIQLERTLTLILIAHVFYNYAVALRMISSFWANQSPRIEEAARVLGAHGWRLWWEVRLPILRPAILAATLLVFIFTFTSFGVILILGGPRFATLEVEIYRQATSVFNLPVAASLSLVQIVMMFAVMIVYTRLQRTTTLDAQSAATVAQRPRTWMARLFVGANVLLMVGLLFAPLGALVLRSFTAQDGTLTLRYYQALGMTARNSVLLIPPVEAIQHSLQFAVVTTLLAVTLGLMTAYLLNSRWGQQAGWLDPLFMLPLATSAVTLGFGFIIAPLFAQTGLRASPLLIPLAHALVAMPFVVRSVLPALRAIPPNLPGAARILGASPGRVWRLIELPLISRGLIVGATFAFTVSMGEFGASAFIANRPETTTMPVIIYRLLGQPGALNYGQALAMSSLLMLVCAVSFLLIERLRTAGVGEF